MPFQDFQIIGCSFQMPHRITLHSSQTLRTPLTGHAVVKRLQEKKPCPMFPMRIQAFCRPSTSPTIGAQERRCRCSLAFSLVRKSNRGTDLLQSGTGWPVRGQAGAAEPHWQGLARSHRPLSGFGAPGLLELMRLSASLSLALQIPPFWHRLAVRATAPNLHSTHSYHHVFFILGFALIEATFHI